MVDLFTREPETFEHLKEPEFTYAESTLNFRSYDVPRGGFGYMSESDDESPTVTIYECTLPESAGYPNFKIESSDLHYNAGTLINKWLAIPANKGTPEGAWILANAEKLNAARRYWDAVKLSKEIAERERRIQEQIDEVRRAKIRLSVNIAEVREGRALTEEERKMLAKEFGATDEDLRP